MKEGLFVGMALGLVTGALLFKHSEAAKEIVNKGEKAVKKEINEMKKKAAPKTKKA